MRELTKKLQAQFNIMCATGNLFKVELSGKHVWDLYLNSFEDGDDTIFRDPKSSEHNCNNCNNFIRRYGNIVSIDANYKLMSLFDVASEKEYEASMKVMDTAIKGSNIKDVFIETFKELKALPYEACTKKNVQFRLGLAKNVKRYTKEEAELFGVVKPNELRTFNHFHIDLPTAFVDKTNDSEATILAGHRDNFNVFLRAMKEIPADTLNLVIDLIKQGSLLDGDTHLFKVEIILKLKLEFDALQSSDRINWAWLRSHELIYAKFKNELVGVLCSELAEGEEINKACQSWNKRVDPANYMKAVAPITAKQKELAKQFIVDGGYVDSFDRRLAILDDIKVDEIKHINSGDGKLEEVSIFDAVQVSSTKHKRNKFEKIEEVSIDKFMQDILPTCTSVEAYLEAKHSNNMVTLTTSNNVEAKQIFKWANPYSWTYNGNLAGKSMIKEAVAKEGGIIDGVLNFRLAWNDSKEATDHSDLDAWAAEPTRTKIGYTTDYRKDRDNRRSAMSGQLDIDNTDPRGKLAVENITWTDKTVMHDGIYKLWVNQYCERNSVGFKAEVEFDGNVYLYSYDRKVMDNVQVAEVTLKDGEFTIKHLLPLIGESAQDIYGIETNQFHKVDLVCLSPNHWGENNTGNKHFFFMLNKCKATSSIKSFHSENLQPEIAKHRKVLEVLSSVNMLDSVDAQLSGLGFNATVKESVVLRLKGNFKRVIKVNF